MKRRKSNKRKGSKKSKKAIYVVDWIGYKPYLNFTNYDIFYTRIANKVFTNIQALKTEFADPISTDNLKQIAINITLYFEDRINGIGHWKAFQTKNKKLYGFSIPFYQEDDYMEKEIMYEDIIFLLWQNCSTLHDTLYNPYLSIFSDTGLDIYAILSKLKKEAPKTDYFEKYLKIDPTQNYFSIKKHLEHFTNYSYLKNISFSFFLS